VYHKITVDNQNLITLSVNKTIDHVKCRTFYKIDKYGIKIFCNILRSLYTKFKASWVNACLEMVLQIERSLVYALWTTFMYIHNNESEIKYSIKKIQFHGPLNYCVANNLNLYIRKYT